METVCVEKGHDPYETTKRVLDKLRFRVENKRVLIKPNLTTSATSKDGITTDVGVCRAILERLKNCDITIGESGVVDTEKSFEINGYTELAREFNCALVDFNKDKIVKRKIPHPFHFKEMPFAETALNAEYIISAAKLKVHSVAGVTLSLKNMFGCVPKRTNKMKIHFYINKGIADMNQIIYPNFSIIDGIVGNERDEVVSYPVDHGIVIAGNDALSVDIAGCLSMGIDPDEIEHIEHMKELKGEREIKIIGEDIKNVMRVYQRKAPFVTSLRHLKEKIENMLTYRK